METKRRQWLEQVANESLRFAGAMRRTVSLRAYTGQIGPVFDLAQADLRSACKRLDPERATDARLERIAVKMHAMVAARRLDGPRTFLDLSISKVLLRVADLIDLEPLRPELSSLEQPAAPPLRPERRPRPSDLSEEL
jgi:hypothetical protein